MVASLYAFFAWPCDATANEQAPFNFARAPRPTLVNACDVGLRLACDMHAPKDRVLRAPHLPLACCLAATYAPALFYTSRDAPEK